VDVGTEADPLLGAAGLLQRRCADFGPAIAAVGLASPIPHVERGASPERGGDHLRRRGLVVNGGETHDWRIAWRSFFLDHGEDALWGRYRFHDRLLLPGGTHLRGVGVQHTTVVHTPGLPAHSKEIAQPRTADTLWKSMHAWRIVGRTTRRSTTPSGP